jgi:hypothetical protein
MCSASFVISLGSLIDGMSSKQCPLFDAPQAVEILWGRPWSRPLQPAMESGAVTVWRSAAEQPACGLDRLSRAPWHSETTS